MGSRRSRLLHQMQNQLNQLPKLQIGTYGKPKHQTPQLWEAAMNGNIKAVKQHLAAGTDVNAKNDWGWTPLHEAAFEGRKEIAELLLANGADVNAKSAIGATPLDWVEKEQHKETADLLRKHGGKTKKELEAAGN